MYCLSTLEGLGSSALTHPAAPLRYRDKWRDDRVGVAFVKAVLVQYRRDGMH